MLKKILTFFFIFHLTACVPNWYKPLGWRVFKYMPKDGSPGMKLGWIHGCQSGLGTQFGGAFYQSFYSWSRDPDITSSKPDIAKIKLRYKKELKDINWNDKKEIEKNFADYNTIFWNSHYFCRQVVLGTLQAADMEAPLPGEERYGPGRHSIGNVWKLNGRGDTRIGSSGLW
jgi:hypothetical protein